jgi:hypothetical protein
MYADALVLIWKWFGVEITGGFCDSILELNTSKKYIGPKSTRRPKFLTDRRAG